MQADFSTFVYSRIESIMNDLRKNHAGYAVAWTKRRELYDLIDPILRSEGSLTIAHGDCQNLRDDMEQDFITIAVMQEDLYRQGYLDCVELLRTMGVLR